MQNARTQSQAHIYPHMAHTAHTHVPCPYRWSHELGKNKFKAAPRSYQGGRWLFPDNCNLYPLYKYALFAWVCESMDSHKHHLHNDRAALILDVSIRCNDASQITSWNNNTNERIVGITYEINISTFIFDYSKFRLWNIFGVIFARYARESRDVHVLWRTKW